jgi:CRP-like cAMP-binding protein
MEHRYAASTRPALPERAITVPPMEATHASRRPAVVPAPPGAALWRALFGGPTMPAAECEALADVAQVRQVAAGQSIFSHSEPATSVVALREGEVALGLCIHDGTFRTERIVRGPAWLDLSSGWLDDCHSMDARASTPVSVVELPQAGLTQALRLQPGLGLRMIQALAREVQALAANTHELMHKDAPARLAQWLAQRCEPAVGSGEQAVVHLRERKRDVASQLAITPETLSRLMRSFTRLGVIEVAGYTVHILDTQALARMAQA